MAKYEVVFGMHAVQSILKSAPQRVREVAVLRGRRDLRMQKIVAAVNAAGLDLRQLDKKQLESMCQANPNEPANHQGVVALVEPGRSFSEADLYPMVQQLLDAGEAPLILVLDGVTDPHNLGACMRTADAAGVHAVVVPKDNSASLNEVARKVASGAGDTVPLIPITNLARTLKKLQELNLWVAGTDGEAEHSIYATSLIGPRVIVMGAEGSGMRRLTRETCDDLVSIPLRGTVASLNVSVATGIVLFEVVRQRLLAQNK